MTLVAMLIAMTSCNKWDCNGDLDGMWQLTEWRDKDNAVKATKRDMIFYSFQLQMASFRKQSGERFFIRTSMAASPEQIDGIFQIQVLTGSTMVLKTSGQDVLTFRKY